MKKFLYNALVSFLTMAVVLIIATIVGLGALSFLSYLEYHPLGYYICGALIAVFSITLIGWRLASSLDLLKK
jgi:hypothetical protein